MKRILTRVALRILIALLPATLLCGATGLARVPLSFEPDGRDFVATVAGSRIILASAGAAIGENRMRLLGVRAHVHGHPEELLPGYSNYLVGNDPRNWRTHVPNYRRVRYQNVYPGIDVVYYGNPRELEFDFIVAPGADPRRIQLSLSRDFHLKPPRIYQADRAIEGRVARHGNRVTFELGPYDHSLPLVIDPVLSYASLFGGGSSDDGRAIAVDSTGAVYVAGGTSSGNFPAINGQVGRFSYLAKLNPAGNALVYATYLPSLGFGAPVYAIGSSGEVYLAQASGGVANSPLIGPAPLKKCVSGFGGGPDIAVARLSADGTSLLYAGCLGGSSADVPNAITADAAGNAYITGFTQSADFPLVKPLQSTVPSALFFTLGFVLKLGPDGALLYSTFLGGGGENPRAIAADRAGSAYVTGQTSSADFPLKNAIQGRRSGASSSAFVAKITADGSSLVYSTYIGGSSGDPATAIAVDGSGNAYIAGNTSSADFPVTANAFQSHFSGIFAFKTTDGAATWSRSDSGLHGSTYNVQVDPGNSSILYALSAGGLFRSNDAGATWHVAAADFLGALWIDPADSTLYASSFDGKLLRSRDSGASFATVATGIAGTINGIAFNPQNPSVIYGRWGGTGTGDGVYKTIDGGDTWKPTGLVGRGEGRGGLVVDPAHPATLYATSNSKGFVQSDDGGDTWTPVNIGFTPNDIQIDSHSRLFLTSGTAILIKTDDTLVRKSAPGGVNKFVIDPIDSSVWYVVVYGSGVYKSTDSGDHWQPVNDRLPDSQFIESLAIDPKSPSILYLGVAAPSDTFLMKLSADGATLQYATYFGGTGLDLVTGIAVDAAGNAYLTGTTGSTDFPMQAAFRTTGPGFVAKFDSANKLAWSSFLGAALPNGIALGASGDVYLTGSSSGVNFATPGSIQRFDSGNLLRSSDGGATWTGTILPTAYPYSGVSAIDVDPLMPSHVFAIGDRLYASVDGGQTWKPLGKTGFVPISPVTFVLDPLTPTTMYGGGYQFEGVVGVSKTNDGGVNWATTPSPPQIVYGLAIDPKTPSTLYAAMYVSGMYKSTDSGQTWNSVGPLPYAAAVAVDQRNPQLVYASVGKDFPTPNTDGSLYKSQDGGGTWQPINNGLPSGFYANILLADPVVPARVFAVKSFFAGGMYRSDDFGNSWKAIGSGLPPNSVIKVLTRDPNNTSTLYAAPAAGGLYRSQDAGATWTLMPELKLPTVTSIAVDPSNSSIIYVGTQSDPGDAFVMKISQ